MEDRLIVALADGTELVFLGDVDAQTAGDGELLVYDPNRDGRGARRGGFPAGSWTCWYLADEVEVREPLGVIDDPDGLLKEPLTAQELDEAYDREGEGGE